MTSHLVSPAQVASLCCGDLLCSPVERRPSSKQAVSANVSAERRQTIDNGDTEHGGLRAEDDKQLTAMLRKSEKSVVLLLQQDHPWRMFKETLALTR